MSNKCEKCEKCVYWDEFENEQPCCGCVDGCNFEYDKKLLAPLIDKLVEAIPQLVNVICENMPQLIDAKIGELEAVEAEPKRGRWIEDHTNIICSVCATEYSDEIVHMNRNCECEDLYYCPNCGAKMDLEVDNE